MDKKKFLEARYFGLVIGLFIFALFILLRTQMVLQLPQLAVRDIQMQFLNQIRAESVQQGARVFTTNPRVSPNIQLIAVDTNSLTTFGRWPWPRFRHANTLQSLARIQDQNKRENAIMLDFFFFDPSSESGNDFALQRGLAENNRAFLEGVLMPNFDDSAFDEDNLNAFYSLLDQHGSLTNIRGEVDAMPQFYGMHSPLAPFATMAKGYGHATFLEDQDKLFRSQILVGKVSILETVISVDELPGLELVDSTEIQYAWFDTFNIHHTIDLEEFKKNPSKVISTIKEQAPPQLVQDEAGNQQELHVVYKFNNYYIPAITLSLAANYFGVPLDKIQIEIGKHIILPEPTVFDPSTGERVPFQGLKPGQKDLIIPIDRHGAMTINFVGPRSQEPGGDYQTFNVRSYLGYSRASSTDESTWPPSFGVENSILLAGAFSPGMADDEKLTPMGLMYGVEVHANALNSILMNRFVTVAPAWANILILFLLIIGIAFVSSRFTPFVGLISSIIAIMILFLATLFIFELSSVSYDFISPSVAMVLTMISIIVYRVMTEEKEKKRIHGMFGKYVSPSVVQQLLDVGTEPELGGVDKDITVLFSDIRGFTTLSEAMSPQELVNHLNVYLSAMTDIIHEFYGTLDKYVGDEIMCFWGAPLPQTDHAYLACCCALKQMEKLAELNKQWPPERRLDIGIGLNSGTMTVGNMGSIGRMNYTLMGDNVNLGARLEGTNKQYMTHIIISEFTYELVKDRVIARELDNIRVKGKNKPVLIYELIDVK